MTLPTIFHATIVTIAVTTCLLQENVVLGFSVAPKNFRSSFDTQTRLSLGFFSSSDRSSESSSNSNNNNDYDGGNIQKDYANHQLPHNTRYSQLEFKDLEPLPENDTRRQRIERELEIRSQFEEFGDKLWELRSEMDILSTQLMSAIEGGHDDLQETTREKLRAVESRDPELVYMLAILKYEQCKRDGNTEDATRHYERAMQTRSCLPQFNLDGLWVGKYGNRYELINITYVGDTLIAEKVMGDENVPKGEITFQVDLNPLRKRKNNNMHLSSKTTIPFSMNDVLQPIQLTDKAAKKWGTKKLPRYAGLGQVAEHGFRNHQWLDGQLILIGDAYFSFAWLPIEQQIFFGRPSPELALKMIREASGTTRTTSSSSPSFNPSSSSSVSSGDDALSSSSPPPLDSNLAVLKEYAMKCLDKTFEVEDELDSEALFGGCIWYSSTDPDACYFE